MPKEWLTHALAEASTLLTVVWFLPTVLSILPTTMEVL
jgi:hypothetical protein